MKSEEEIEDDIFKVVHNSALPNAITGKIYSGIRRPADSVKEDITIKCIANEIDAENESQTAIVNVNIYIADKLIGKSYEKDRIRCRTIAALAETVLHRGGKGFDFRTTISTINSFEAQGTKKPEHFINIKVKHKSVE